MRYSPCALLWSTGGFPLDLYEAIASAISSCTPGPSARAEYLKRALLYPDPSHRMRNR